MSSIAGSRKGKGPVTLLPEREAASATSLRKGWTTGCCAALAAKAAAIALHTGSFPERVSFRLPGGQVPEFPTVRKRYGGDWAECGIVKDAGDDPDVTHGAMIIARIARGAPGTGVVFRAGPGVGTVTLPGLPLPQGEPAINPVPRKMIRAALQEASPGCTEPLDLVVTISVPGGERLARQTWNPRLGILGGLSILGTTGIVRPFSCAAWIASIQRGIDVAEARGRPHVIAATGSMSEHAARERHGLMETDCLDMGDFVGGTLRYLRRHPIPRLTLAGGIAKFTKLAMGALDLHSKRSRVEFGELRVWLEAHGVPAGGVEGANTVLEVYRTLRDPFSRLVARQAKLKALQVLDGAPIQVEVLVCDREGSVLAIEDFRGELP